jgi:hypothetical protein
MAKRERTAAERSRDLRETLFRRLRAELETYWSMAGTLAADDEFDPALAMRMLRHRARTLETLEFLMPEPRLGELLDAPEKPDQQSVH